MTPSLLDRVAALESTQQEHVNVLSQIQPTVDSASQTVNDLARQIQLNAATPQPTTASAVNNTTQTSVNGVTAHFIAPVSLFASTTTTNSGWTTCAMPGTIPTTAKFLILEWSMILSAGISTPATIYARVNLAASQQRLVGIMQSGAANEGAGSQVGVMVFDTQGMAIDLLATSFAGATLTYAVSVVGYWS